MHFYLREPVKPRSLVRVWGCWLLFLTFLGNWTCGPQIHTGLAPTPVLEPNEGDHARLECSKAQGFEVGGECSERSNSLPSS